MLLYVYIEIDRLLHIRRRTVHRSAAGPHLVTHPHTTTTTYKAAYGASKRSRPSALSKEGDVLRCTCAVWGVLAAQVPKKQKYNKK
jgi:hypothetical protein